MNIGAIIAVIGALIVGGFTGSAITRNDSEEIRGQGNGRGQEQVVKVDDSVPESIDFVSARPEIAALPAEELSVLEIEGIEFMREEEKLARDVYITLYEKWGLRIFSNIAQSEQTHTEAVRDLLEKYDMADPVSDDAIGVFTNDTIQGLYDSLVEQGSVSELEALKVGAMIEDLDIFDLQRYQIGVDNADIMLVYENLERGSRNHLRAFISQIESRGGTYEAQYLTQNAVNEIKDSERERGDNDGMGGQKGSGSGQGKVGDGRGWGGR